MSTLRMQQNKPFAPSRIILLLGLPQHTQFSTTALAMPTTSLDDLAILVGPSNSIGDAQLHALNVLADISHDALPGVGVTEPKPTQSKAVSMLTHYK